MIRLVCPIDVDHGRVLPIAGSRWGWYCPHQAHDRSGARSFFTTAEIEAGIPPSGPLDPATPRAGATSGPLREASAPSAVGQAGGRRAGASLSSPDPVAGRYPAAGVRTQVPTSRTTADDEVPLPSAVVRGAAAASPFPEASPSSVALSLDL